MDTINLCCPSCKAHLTLPSAKANNENLLLVCPKCNFRGNPTSFNRMQAAQPFVSQKSGPDIVDPTVIVGHNLHTALTIGILTDQKSQTMFRLIQGQNRFGRASSSSNCEHQFENNDTFISRKHFEVNVIFNKATLTYDHRLQDLGSKNGTKLNGLKVLKGDILLLKQGDLIMAGKTELVFDFPSSPDDTTLA